MVPAITNKYGEKFKLFWNITDILKHSKQGIFSWNTKNCYRPSIELAAPEN